MRIWCIGLNKTGTTTLHKALTLLGVNSLHDPGKCKQIAEDVMSNKHHPLIDQYEAFLDGPFYLIPKILKHRFPDDKFIFTTRDEEKWIQSRIIHVLHNRMYKPDSSWIHIDTVEWSREWRHHHKYIRQLFANDPNFLQMRICDREGMAPTEGWGRLCAFLDLPEPDQPFPCENKSEWRLERIISAR